MATNISLQKGHKLGDYVINKKLSSGGFSMVYLAYSNKGEPVAIKEFFPNNLHLRKRGTHISFINTEEERRFNQGLKGFKDETEIVMRLKHKNIIEIIDFFETNNTAYIVMPYEYGMTLSKYINGEKIQNEQEIYSIAIDIFSAVHMFHQNGIIHLDLKPSNIWLRPNKEALILDFGTSRVLDDVVKCKQPPMYTPGYAAPEQHREFFQPQRVGIWTDFYGLGTTLYALLHRKIPLVSTKILQQNIQPTLSEELFSRFNQDALKLVDYLMQPEWEKRKNINLVDIINKLKKIKAQNDLPLMTHQFDILINNFSKKCLTDPELIKKIEEL